MKRLVLLLALSACISDAEVEGALGEYCAVNDGKECAASSQCCPGFGCVFGACRRVTAGTCLFPEDAGRAQASGEACGCTNDCVSGACNDSKCP